MANSVDARLRVQRYLPVDRGLRLAEHQAGSLPNELGLPAGVGGDHLPVGQLFVVQLDRQEGLLGRVPILRVTCSTDEGGLVFLSSSRLSTVRPTEVRNTHLP